jgi:serine phosphatase RsbU (regulator of sigma subunit)
MPAKFLFFLNFIFFFNCSFCQDQYSDSLLNLLKKTKDDSNRVNLLNQISREFEGQTDFTKAKAYALQAISLSEKLNFKKGKALTLKTIGNIYFDQGDYSKSLEFFFHALKIRDSIQDILGVAAIHTNIGNTYNNQFDYSKALEYYGKAIKIYEQLKMRRSPQYFNALLGAGTSYEGKLEYEKALEYYLKTKEIAEQNNDEGGLVIVLNNIGNVYKENEKQYSESLEYYFRSLKIGEKIEDDYNIATILNNIGSIYHIQKKNKEALAYCSKSLVIARKIKNPDLAKDAEYLLSFIYEDLGDKGNALLQYRGFIHDRDSIFSNEKMRDVANQEFKIKEEKREIEFKEEQIKKDAELKQQKIIGYAVTIGLMLVLILIVVVFRSLRQSRKSNKIIEIQKAEVEQKNVLIEHKQKEILDSITYAQHIQQAILPPLNDIYKALPNSFVLFKPKDIVSGDFFWFSEKENKIFIAAADCTGHGVPGAIMSMLCSDKLNDAVINFSDVSSILQSVNVGLKKALRQSNKVDSTRDGMDIALCAFNKEMTLVEYSGANRPFWIIRNGRNEVEEIKATKTAIGGFTENEQVFVKHIVELQKGDIVYLFSDGYADQFSANDKKLMTKKFKSNLLEIGNKPMFEQKEFLDIFIENWKGGMEQTDDILVIGIKV